MTPWKKLGTAKIPNSGGELQLSQRGEEFSIRLSGVRGELMNSRVYNSEQVLAELGCKAIQNKADAHVLVGGLGMGYTLSASLANIASSAQVTVAELIPEVVEWNKGPLGNCANNPLRDARTTVHYGDVAELLNTAQERYDAILLDVDNGPEGLTQADNNWLYSQQGLEAISQTLRPEGVLAIWSAGPDSMFAIRLKKAQFNVTIHTVRARPGKGSRHTIFLAQKRWQSPQQRI
ncbi:Polyamine aminopropyltransferase [Zhongshania aliphaticivorans]|uniref:Polyamine aminopropyltransferase n=1 Tax=Zhongshania aliphaticivorans TaxID=1470434 RepID=A0A5S9NI00_9GAMM|nr:MnmC family methyltransferase [Zhongshania aliphaticivorans]CAA0090104.1 Polyamine aminopropyltransferase [Zhongshania aliphaticivorans]CAA0097411.1 Polyamine aminopropyltransferase [Zhongshania aliphaticivorans]